MPSIVVRSGHGVHLYWLLLDAYLIDDVPNPEPVFRRFTNRKPERYLLADGEEITESDPRFKRCLSRKAHAVQDVLAGIVERVGGDKTTDLARILRLPGTLNRKNERNGQSPVPCELAECHSDRRYDFALFETILKKKNKTPAGGKSKPRGEESSPNASELQSALRKVDGADDYQRWIAIGMCLNSCADVDGFRLWCDWSSSSDKYSEDACRAKWATFNPGAGLTVATIFKLARDNGWDPSPAPKTGGKPATAATSGKADEPTPATEAHLTDVGNASRFATLHLESASSCASWQRGKSGMAARCAKTTRKPSIG